LSNGEEWRLGIRCGKWTKRTTSATDKKNIITSNPFRRIS
jgi:hypothetical protein